MMILGVMRKVSFLILVLGIYISVKHQNADYPSWSRSEPSSILSALPVFMSMRNAAFEIGEYPKSLEYDFYRESCPKAEAIVKDIVRHLYKVRSNVAPALLRLVFHDCFIEGCDASVLLDAAEGIGSEKESPPNETLKGFDIIEIIKSELEKVCPGVVSCADIIVLAAREGVVLSGGPFYPLHTGRRDSKLSFSDIATYELPTPHADLPETLAAFASRGFDERETVILLGAHSIGAIHCQFFQNRLYNFGGTDEPDPSLDIDFLNLMRSKCSNSSHSSPSSSPTPFDGSPSSSFTGSPSPSFTGSPLAAAASPLSAAGAPSVSFDCTQATLAAPSPYFNASLSPSAEEPAMGMDYEGRGSSFGTLYYRSLLQGKGILYADQQLMAGEETRNWVRAYASDASLFRRDFALAMMKLSNLRVLTASKGQIRHNCSKVTREER